MAIAASDNVLADLGPAAGTGLWIKRAALVVLGIAVLALTAVGLSLVFGVMRVVNVAHGAFFMLGAVLAWWVAQAVGGPVWLGFAAALVVAPLLVGVIAAAADVTVLKRLEYDPERTIVATIGLLYIVEQATLMTFGPEARPVEAPFNQRLALPWVEWAEGGLALYWPWGLSTTTYKLAVIGAAAVLLLGVWALMARSRIGLVMRATQADREMALAFGIPVGRVYALVFGLGAGLAALGAAALLSFGLAAGTWRRARAGVLGLILVAAAGWQLGWGAQAGRPEAPERLGWGPAPRTGEATTDRPSEVSQGALDRLARL